MFSPLMLPDISSYCIVAMPFSMADFGFARFRCRCCYFIIVVTLLTPSLTHATMLFVMLRHAAFSCRHADVARPFRWLRLATFSLIVMLSLP